MYGMTPSAKIDSLSSAPPEKRLTSPSRPWVPLFWARHSETLGGKLTNGAGTVDPRR